MRFRGQHKWRPVAVVALSAALVGAGVAPNAFASGLRVSTVSDDPPTTTIPPITDAPVITPGTTAQTTATTVAGATTTSSTSSTSTTSSIPGTTLPPVDDATVDEETNNYASVPAPIIPSASDDPLFHAALTVDDDLVLLSKAKVAYIKQIAATRKVAARASNVSGTYNRVAIRDDAAADKLTASRSILRAAALHAYAGFGSVETAEESPQVDNGDKVLPYRTYVRVTIADATQHVKDAQAAYAATHEIADAAQQKHLDAQAELRKAQAAEKTAKKSVADATATLKRDREALRKQIEAMPDLAPGTLDKLPDDFKLPEGASRVESPVGTIIVPATADPRTAVALEFIVAQIGKPYIWGGTGPTGYDCSGLMLRAFQAAGVTSMPRVSQAQQVWATDVPFEKLQPGDLVFFGRPAYHVGIYIGGGLMIDAPFTGARVRVDRVWPSVTSYGRAVW